MQEGEYPIFVLGRFDQIHAEKTGDRKCKKQAAYK